MAGGGFVALALRPEALADDCERAALIVTARQPPAACARLGDRCRAPAPAGRAGAAANGRDGFVVDAVKPRGFDRPWSPAVAGDGEAEADHPRAASAAPRAVDATPAEADLQADE